MSDAAAVTSHCFSTAMAKIKAYLAGWTGRRAPAELAAFAAGAIVIAVVPGALIAWLTWRLLRARTTS
jgi:hypothetical protein